MKFSQTDIPGLWRIELEPRGDDRGFFARMFCTKEFQQHGLIGDIAQINDSYNAQKGTLRGLHYQLPPHAEVKVVRCTRGAIWDLALDLRTGSATFGHWYGTELTAENRAMLYVPEGFAHGFITLTDHTELMYLATSPYAPDSERGVRWDDPRFSIRWPLAPEVISEKDRGHRDFDPAWHVPSG